MKLSRRQFIIRGVQGGGALVVGVQLGCGSSELPKVYDAVKSSGEYMTAYIKISAGNKFTFTMDKSEMGQGVITSLATIFGEEAAINPTQFKIVTAPVNPIYNSEVMGSQMTGGSTSVWERYDVLREAGAHLRAVMIKAAEKKQGANKQYLIAREGYVIDTQNHKKYPYSDLIEEALSVSVGKVELKKQSQFKYMGKESISLDAHEKSHGLANYGIDRDLPNMVIASVERCPVFAGKVKSFNASDLEKQPGFIDCFEIPMGIAIVFEKYWQLQAAKSKLKIDWDFGSNKDLNSEDLYKQFAQSIDKDSGSTFMEKGDVSQALNPSESFEVEYQLPYLAHSAMEPMNCTVNYSDKQLDIYTPTQGPTLVQALGARITGLPRKNVIVHTTLYLGGGFGRRSTLDYNAEAIVIAQKLKRPVKLIWSREEDTQFSPLRPLTVHKLKGQTKEGKITAWEHHISGQSIMHQKMPSWMPLLTGEWLPNFAATVAGKAASMAMKFSGEAPAFAKGADVLYEIDNLLVKSHFQEVDVPVHFWRSVEHSYTGFVTECFFDELAHKEKKDPLQFRLELLGSDKRAYNVVEKVAKLAKWQEPLAKGRFRGIAFHKSFNTYVAEVAEVEVVENDVQVKKVYCVVDCGKVVNPHIVRDQMRSGIIYGLSAVVNSEITIKAGQIEQSNFHDYEPLRLNQSPEIEIEIVKSQEAPTGVGEPGLPPIAAAVGNAVFAATGQRVRRLPIRLKNV